MNMVPGSPNMQSQSVKKYNSGNVSTPELKCEIQFIELFIPSENSQIFYGFPAAHVTHVSSKGSASLVTSKLQPPAVNISQQKNHIAMLLCTSTSGHLSTTASPKHVSEKPCIIPYKKEKTQLEDEKINSTMMDMHSYSSLNMEVAHDSNLQIDMPQTSTVLNSAQPVIKIEPVTEECCSFWNPSESDTAKNSKKSQKKAVIESNMTNMVYCERNDKELEVSCRSALEELLLSDIGCPPNKQVVAEHFKNLEKAPSKSTKSRSFGSAFQDISNSKRCNTIKNLATSVKGQTMPIHQKTAQKKICRKRSVLNCGLINKQRSHFGQSTSETRADSINFKGALQIVPPTEYSLPCTPSNIELAKNLSLSPSNLSPDLVLERKESILKKLSSVSSMPLFTQEEEFDIHCRAEAYVDNVIPDPDYYIFGDDAFKHIFPYENKENTVFPGCQIPGTTAGKTQSARKRRRHLSVIDNYLTINPYSRYYPQLANCVTLTDGCQLLKPPVKLVELVAQAINDSPDGMLQVQQVYHCIQKRYPFFQYLDRTSMTSWRSSIRHALYQKWFRKLQFDIDLINSKGCYWGINRRNRPKEWALPPNTGQEYPLYSQEFLQTFGDSQNFPSVELVEIDDEYIIDSGCARDELLDNPIVSMDCLSPTLKIAGTGPAYRRSRDPDPMLTQPGPLSQDLPQSLLNAERQQDDFDLNVPEHLSSDTSVLSPFGWQSGTDENSFSSSLAWIPTFEDNDDDDSCLQRIGSGESLGMTDLPDIASLEPDQVSMCLQKTYPHDEHW